MGKALSDIFLRKHTNGQSIHKKVFNITNHQENKIKITMRYCLIPIRMEIITKKMIYRWPTGT